jgi:hypothetical protein
MKKLFITLALFTSCNLFSQTITLAPFSMAVGINEWPSACKPLIATNTAPLMIFLESICIG